MFKALNKNLVGKKSLVLIPYKPAFCFSLYILLCILKENALRVHDSDIWDFVRKEKAKSGEITFSNIYEN